MQILHNKGTRGSGRVRKMWSVRERVRTGTGMPSTFRSRPRLPNPFLTLVSIPAIYRPDLGHLVRVPTVFRPAVRCISGISRPTVCPVVPIRFRRSHTVLPIPQLAVVADIPISSQPTFIYSRLYHFLMQYESTNGD